MRMILACRYSAYSKAGHCEIVDDTDFVDARPTAELFYVRALNTNCVRTSQGRRVEVETHSGAED